MEDAMEFYRCENTDCGFLAEEEPDVCPRCGGTFFQRLDEEELTAGDWVSLGNQAVEEHRGTDALASYQRAAAMGDALGLTNLGWCFESGVGVEEDPQQGDDAAHVPAGGSPAADPRLEHHSGQGDKKYRPGIHSGMLLSAAGGHSRFSLCFRIQLVRRNMMTVGMRSRRMPSQ